MFEAKFMLPWSFSEEAAAEKRTTQLQHNMWVTNAIAAVLSIITGGGKWVEIKIPAGWLVRLSVGAFVGLLRRPKCQPTRLLGLSGETN